jgi:hypothetical protein
MNDLTFAATLLSILVTLTAAVCDEATRAPTTRIAAPVVTQASSARIQVASASATNGASVDSIVAQSAGR